MLPENAASGPPWPILALPWPSITYLNGYSPRLDIEGLVPVWAVGPVDGPVTHIGSAAPRLRFHRLANTSAVPLAVHDIRWCRGRQGHALARALRKIFAGQITPTEHRILVEVEATRLGITLADHTAVVRAVEVDAQAAADAELLAFHPGKSLAEIKSILEGIQESRGDDRVSSRDLRTTLSFERWEANFRRTGGTRPKKLFQRNRKIATAYREGATLEAIGAAHGLSFGRIRQILIDQGVDRRLKGGYIARRSTAT